MNKQTLRNVVIAGLFVVPLVPFVVSSSFFFPYVVPKALAWRLLVELVFCAWLVLALTTKGFELKRSPILFSALAFLGVIGLANILGQAPLNSFWSNFERMDGFLGLLHLGAYFVVAGSVLTPELWQKWWRLELLASGAMSLYALLQILGWARISQGDIRVEGLLGNATYLAVYVLFNIFIAGFFLIKEWGRKNWRFILIVLSVLHTIVLYYTATRGAILGLIGGVILFAILNSRNQEQVFLRKVSYIALALVLALVVGFVAIKNTNFVNQSPVLSRFSTLSVSEIKTQGRYFVWPMAWEGFKEKPLLGWGQENFALVFQEHYSAQMYKLEPWFDRAHNIFLDWLVAGGALGLLAYLSLYLSALYMIWFRGGFSYAERSVLTALLGAYFFHNFFVFDQLISYILFFSLLAFIHSVKAEGDWLKPVSKLQNLGDFVTAFSVVALVGLMYVFIWQPLNGSVSLIAALRSLQVGQFEVATKSFEEAYKASRLGRVEVVEQIVIHEVEILQSPLSIQKKNDFYNFTKMAVDSLSPELDNSARYNLTAGTFYTSVGDFDRGITLLKRAEALMPEKQQISFQLGATYLNKGAYKEALDSFKYAYELEPEFEEAQIIYLVGAIYAGDRKIESEMLKLIPEKIVRSDERILSAYKNVGR